MVGPPVDRGEYLTARNYLFAVCFSPEIDANTVQSAWEEWLRHTPGERVPALEAARSASMRELAAYWGAIWDSYTRQGGEP
jgi:hypothetical protein